MQRSGRNQRFCFATMLWSMAFMACTVPIRAAEPVAHRVLTEKPANTMLRYFQGLAKNRPPRKSQPESVKAWEQQRSKIRAAIRDSMGDFPFDERPPLNPKITGTIDGGDIVIEKVLYESLPGLYVTALLYRPKDVSGPLPAVLNLNGHWAEAKFTDHIQMRCQSLAKMGVIAFCQDVIGTGERSAPAGSPHVTYHGIYRGGVAQITGRSLFGYEMFEAIRALDYLTSRSEIDPKRIICTGASGGGMQSMYLPAIDDRPAGAVPVCYISSYHQHIGATACVGEVIRGVLNYTDQWELLGMHAPRPLLCISATRDVSWFQPVHAIEALQRARREFYELYE
ncbi:MAG: alpha/beta hydrolase family protein, partial [Planctomycetaceae bacterium]